MFEVEIIGSLRKIWKFQDGNSFDGYEFYLVGVDPMQSPPASGKQAFIVRWSLDIISGLDLSVGRKITVAWNNRKQLVPFRVK